MSNKKNDNQSLFIYTGLIFFVALLLIILSFFGQKNLKKNQPKVDEPAPEAGISERAAILSEENKNLIEENKQLKEQNTILIEKQTANDLLLSAYGYMSLGNNAKAGEMLLAVNYELLTSDQKIIYDNIKKVLN